MSAWLIDQLTGWNNLVCANMYRDSLSAYFNNVMYVQQDSMETHLLYNHTPAHQHTHYKTATHTSPRGDFHMLTALNQEKHTHTLQSSDESDSSKH